MGFCSYQGGDEAANLCIFLKPAGASAVTFLFGLERPLPFKSMFIYPTPLS